jgi:hypothetical protein
VAIIGKAPASRDLAPYDDATFEIWTLSDLVPRKQVPRFNRHFELHPPDGWLKKRPKQTWQQVSPEYWEWLKTIPPEVPCYMHCHIEDIPASRPYPLMEVLNYFGPYPYFNNTVSWLLAFAIMQGAETVGVYGVDMAQTREYREQRPSCEWLIGWAQGKGIEVLVPEECDLLKAPFLYGFEADQGRMARKHRARTEELRGRLRNKRQQIQECDAQRDQFIKEACYLEGAMESQEYFSQICLTPTETLARKRYGRRRSKS